MIQVQRIIDDIRSIGLDATPDSDYYNDSEDIIPAINSSVRWLVSLIDSARSKNKRVDEVLKYLAKTRIYQLDNKSRFLMEDKVWTVDAIQPLPCSEAIPNIPPVVQTDPAISVERTDLVHVSSNYDANRKTIEEWATNKNNPFAQGNAVIPCAVSDKLIECSDLNVSFAYLNPYEYVENQGEFLFEVRPFIPNKLTTIFYVKTPTEVVAGTDELEFADNLFGLIYDKALQFVSYNQGDGTNVYGITDADIQRLMQSISK